MNFFRTHNSGEIPLPFITHFNVYYEYATYSSSVFRQYIIRFDMNANGNGLSVTERGFIRSHTNNDPKLEDVDGVEVIQTANTTRHQNIIWSATSFVRYYASATTPYTHAIPGQILYIRTYVKTKAGITYSDVTPFQVCISPSGLTNISILYAIREKPETEWTDFYKSLAEAEDALAKRGSTDFEFAGVAFRVESIDVGKTIYFSNHDACNTLTNGFFIPVTQNVIVEVTDGVIQNIYT